MSAGRYALVAGGGTGGHLVPAMALAQALAEGRSPGAVELVGSRRGLDAALLSGTGLAVSLLPGRGVVRRLDPASMVANAGAVASLAWAVVLAIGMVLRRRPRVVVAVGGYASVPVAVAAFLAAVPVVLVNVDVRPGAANRLVGRFARVAAVGFEGTALPRAVVTGVPLRPEITSRARPGPAERRSARRRLGIADGRQVVGAVGGSLGARRLNEAVLGLARRWSVRGDLALYHVVGSRDFGWASSDCPPTAGLWYRQVEFEEHMADFYVAADVVVCRAGAVTVAELAAVGVAALLVPLPGAPGDHQRANAEVLAAVGAAVVVDDAELDAERLERELDGLLADAGRLETMARSAAAVGRPQALAAVTDLVDAQARAGRQGRARP